MDFIERIFGVSPDGGNGSLEFMARHRNCCGGDSLPVRFIVAPHPRKKWVPSMIYDPPGLMMVTSRHSAPDPRHIQDISIRTSLNGGRDSARLPPLPALRSAGAGWPRVSCNRQERCLAEEDDLRTNRWRAGDRARRPDHS
jgi:hypothetical protein